MPDEAPEATPDTPEAELEGGSPTEATPDQTNWQQRYENLEPEFTRTAQERAELRGFVEQLANPENREEAIAALEAIAPHLLEEPEGVDEEDFDFDVEDPSEAQLRALAERQDAIEAQLQERSSEELVEMEEDLEDQYLAQEIGKIENTEHVQLPDEVQQAIAGLALSLPDSEGLPDVQAAFEVFKTATTAQQNAYLQTKRAGGPLPGEAGTQPVDMTNEDQRVQAIADAITAENEAQAQ